MDERDVLARRFDAERGRLRAVAYRMLGSLAEAEDAVQEAWLRLARSDEAAIENLSGWLTTVVGRVHPLIRFSPHYYNTEEEMDRTTELVAALAS